VVTPWLVFFARIVLGGTVLIGLALIPSGAWILAAQQTKAEAQGPPPIEEEKQRLFQAVEFLTGLSDKVSLAEVRARVYIELAAFFGQQQPDRSADYFRMAMTEIEKLQPEDQPRGALSELMREQQQRRRKEQLLDELIAAASLVDQRLANEVLERAARNRSAALATRARELALERASFSVAPDRQGTLPQTTEAVQQEDLSLNAINFLVSLRLADPVAADRTVEELLTRLASRPPDTRALALLGLYFLPQDKTHPPNEGLLRKYVQLLSIAIGQLLSRPVQPIEIEELRNLYEHLIVYATVHAGYGSDIGPALEAVVYQIAARLPPEQRVLHRFEQRENSDPPLLLANSRVAEEIEQALAAKNFEKARHLSEQIAQLDERRRALDRVNVVAARQALEQKHLEAAAAYAKAVSDNFERGRLYLEMARLCEPHSEGESNGVAYLNYAYSAVDKEDPSPKKLRFLAEIILLSLERDKFQGIQRAYGLVTLMNKLWSGFSDDYSALVQMGDALAEAQHVFVALGQVDFDQALSLAHQLDNLNLRVPMGIAACKGAWQRLTAEARKPATEARPAPATSPKAKSLN